MDKKKNKNYWPQAILGIILTVVIGGAFSIKAALNHPVQESTYFMEHYQGVEDNAYKLEKQKDKFDKNFKIIYSIKKFKIGKNNLSLKIINRVTNKLVNNADITMLLTRPDTNDLNKKLKPKKMQNGSYIFGDLDIQRLGRWKLLTTTKVEGFRGFNSYDINATRK